MVSDGFQGQALAYFLDDLLKAAITAYLLL
jgi:hypothetical protein